MPLFGLVLDAAAITRYVDLNSPSATPPYTNWATAATAIQDAVDVAAFGDLVLVTNGVYATGGRALIFTELTNRVFLSDGIHLKSVNGPSVTVIEGAQGSGDENQGAIRCALLSVNSSISGFTLTNGHTKSFGLDLEERSGGGVAGSGDVTNCVIINCSASYRGGGVVLVSAGPSYYCAIYNCAIVGNAALDGGGAYNCDLFNCSISNNIARSNGGGVAAGSLWNCVVWNNQALFDGGGISVASASVVSNCFIGGNVAREAGGYIAGRLINSVIATNRARYAGAGLFGELINCTVVANVATDAVGGIHGGTLANCILYSNAAPESPDHVFTTMDYTCTSQPPLAGVGNFTSQPQFFDFANGNYRLASGSPCINAGGNGFAINQADLDGNPRMVGGTVDIGAYEYQSPSSLLSYAWAQQYGLATDGSVDFADPDSDGMNNYGEWRSDTVPTNSSSGLRMIVITNNPTGMDVSWQSVPTRSYWLERATNLGPTWPFQIIATNIPGAAGLKNFTDTSATNSGPYFYRVGVH